MEPLPHVNELSSRGINIENNSIKQTTVSRTLLRDLRPSARYSEAKALL